LEERDEVALLFDCLSCCRTAMLVLFGFRPLFSLSICCFDLTKKVTILWKTMTDVAPDFDVK
jgi:hypothetical protein